jgi:hypothetical protein
LSFERLADFLEIVVYNKELKWMLKTLRNCLLMHQGKGISSKMLRSLIDQ